MGFPGGDVQGLVQALDANLHNHNIMFVVAGIKKSALLQKIRRHVYRADSQVLMKRLTFAYDSTGRRIEKRVYSYNPTTLQHDTLESVTRYVYDGWLLIAELSPAAIAAIVAIVANEPTGDLTPLRTYHPRRSRGHRRPPLRPHCQPVQRR